MNPDIPAIIVVRIIIYGLAGPVGGYDTRGRIRSGAYVDFEIRAERAVFLDPSRRGLGGGPARTAATAGTGTFPSEHVVGGFVIVVESPVKRTIIRPISTSTVVPDAMLPIADSGIKPAVPGIAPGVPLVCGKNIARQQNAGVREIDPVAAGIISYRKPPGHPEPA